MAEKLYVGVDLGGTNVKTGLVNSDGVILARDERVSRARESAEAPVQQIVDSIGAVVASGGAKMSGIRGIGIGSPGPLDAREGKILRAGNLPHWVDFPLVAVISERTGCPAYLQNDANMFAYGEWWRGSGQGIDDFFAITLGTGLGAGAVSGGRLMLGFNDNACEFGHTTVDFNGPQCWCGQKGCIELYASATGLVRVTNDELKNVHVRSSLEPYRSKPAELTSKIIYDAAIAGDAFAKSMYDKVGYILGISLVNAQNILNFKRVAIGGGMSQAGDLIMEPVRRGFMARAFESYSAEIEIVQTKLLADAGILGCVRLVIDHEEGTVE